MKKIHILIIILLISSLTWALYEKSSKNNLLEKVQKLEAEYLKTTKDNDFLRDKIKSLEGKTEFLLKQKEELSNTLTAKDEFISSLEEKLNEKQESITRLQKQIENLKNLIASFQGSGESVPEQ